MDARIDTILESSEQIIWRGKINRKVINFLLITSLLTVSLLGIFVLTRGMIGYTSNGQSKQISGFIVGSLVIFIGFAFSFLVYFQNLVKEYATTSKRIIIKSGLIGTDFKSVYYNEIKEVLVNVGLIGKIFSVGTIKIDTGKTETYSTGGNRNGNAGTIRTRTMYSSLDYIDNPYDVYKYVQLTLNSRIESLYSGRADKESLGN